MSRLRELCRRLGPRWTAGIGAGVVAVLAVAAAAIASGGSGGPPPRKAVAAHRGVPVAGSTLPSVTTTAVHPSAKARARARTHRKKPAPAAHHAHHRVAPTTTSSSTGGGTSTTTTHPTTTSASTSHAPPSFSLSGGGDASIVACGALHHFRTYAAGSAISYSGGVNPVPSAIWKVKVKIKICRGGQFVDFVKFNVTKGKHGAFSGSFTAPPAGLYYARAELYVNDMNVAQSSEIHFETR